MTKSTHRLLISGSVLRVTNLVAQVSVAFFLTPFVIHSLGDRLNGLWVFVGALTGYYGLVDLGLAWAVGRYVSGALGKGDQNECARVFNAAFQLYTVMGVAVLAVSCVAAALAPHLTKNSQDAALAWKLILILGFNVALTFPVRAHAGLLTAELRLDALAAVEMLCLFLRAIFVVAVMLAGLRVLALAWVTFLTGLPRIYLYVYLAHRQCPWLRLQRQPWFGETTKKLFSYSVLALIAKVADQLRLNADAFVITAFVGLAAVTHFNIAGMMVGYFLSLIIALIGFVMPLFSRLEGKGATASMTKAFLFTTKVALAASSFIAFGFLAWGRPFIERWMGRSYLDGYPCLVVLTVGWLVDLAQVPSSNLLYALSKHKFYAISNTVEGVANLILSIWLAGRLGILGVALGTCIPMVIVRLFILPVFVCRAASLPVREYARFMARCWATAALSLAAPALISWRFVGPWYPNLFAVGAVSAICYATATWFFQFNGQERRVLREALGPIGFSPDNDLVAPQPPAELTT